MTPASGSWPGAPGASFYRWDGADWVWVSGFDHHKDIGLMDSGRVMEEKIDRDNVPMTESGYYIFSIQAGHQSGELGPTHWTSYFWLD